jgi:signal transduction histidine kinase
MVAWRDHVPLHISGVWCALAIANYMAQAVVCWRMARASSLTAAMPRWMPCLCASVAVSGFVWGAVPWLVISASAPVLLFACTFNAMLAFCGMNAPATLLMLLCAVLPVSALTTAALASRSGLLSAAAGFAMLFGIIFLYGLRMHAAIQATMMERHLANDLTDELRRQQQRLVEVERERSVLLERQRLMRDMHDGMGSALLASLAVVEQGQLDAKGVAALLRECVDDLRLVIDSLEPMGHDLATLLATLRYRLGGHLEASGITLDWQVQDLPALTWMGPTEALQVMRIVQEVLANVIKHAQAKRVGVTASLVGDHVEVCISDDGAGFDTSAASTGRGQRFLAQRSVALGGDLQVVSRPGSGTLVRLRLPLASMN